MRENQTPLTGGWVTSGVVRIGNTVRRPPGPRAPFVRRLLDHLESQGFVEAPRYLGADDQGREALSFQEGDVPSDCRSIVWSDEQLSASATLLLRFHDATAGSALAGEQEVVCHNDFGPWNLVWQREVPVAIIDFDNAAPGRRLDDLGYAVWKHLNVGLIDLSPSEQRRRMRVMCAAYGVAADQEVVDAIERAQERMRQRIANAPLSTQRNEATRQIEAEVEWIQAHGPLLVSAL